MARVFTSLYFPNGAIHSKLRQGVYTNELYVYAGHDFIDLRSILEIIRSKSSVFAAKREVTVCRGATATG